MSEIVVEYRKWPAQMHYRTTMTLLAEDDDGIWVGARAGDRGERAGKRPYLAASQSVSYFPRGRGWTARWYPSRARTGRAAQFSCYVDITTPVERTEWGVRLVDLDLDVARTWDGGVVLLDEDEFARNRVKLGYPPAVALNALVACAEARDALQAGVFPFDGAAERHTAAWFGEPQPVG